MLQSSVTAQSPKINIFENLWDTSHRNVSRCRPNTIDALWKECKQQSIAIPNETI